MISEFPTLESNRIHNSKRTGDTMFVDFCTDLCTVHSEIVFLLNFRIGCCTTVNNFTALYLLSVCDLIARYDIPMSTKGSCLNLTKSGSNIQTVTSITPSKAVIFLFLYYTLAGLHQIRLCNARSTCLLETRYRLVTRGATRLNNVYYIIKHKNMRW